MILLTGGSGLLGRHLRQYIDCLAPCHADFDVSKPSAIPEGVTMIVHCAAYTDVARAEVEREQCYGINVVGTLNMALTGLPLVYISTEYVFDGMRGDYDEEDQPNPINYYAATKHQGEHMAMHASKWLVIRTLFKPWPFEHPRAVTDQHTSGDYVQIIAPLIVRAISMFEAGVLNGVINIGTGRKSTFDLASQSRDVKPMTRKEACVPLPRDTSLNTTRWRRLTM